MQSNYVTQFVHSLRGLSSTTPCWLWCRVSARSQEHKGHLDHQEQNLRTNLAHLDIQGCTRHLGPGWHTEDLVEASDLARAHGAMLLAESPDRFLRNRQFHSYLRWDLQPTKHDWELLTAQLGNTKLYTLWEPSLSPEEIRGLQSRRSELITLKKEEILKHRNKNPRRERWAAKALELDLCNLSLREIADLLSDLNRAAISHMAVRDWIVWERERLLLGSLPNPPKGV